MKRALTAVREPSERAEPDGVCEGGRFGLPAGVAEPGGVGPGVAGGEPLGAAYLVSARCSGPSIRGILSISDYVLSNGKAYPTAGGASLYRRQTAHLTGFE